MIETCKRSNGGCGFSAPIEEWRKKENPLYKDLFSIKQPKIYNYFCPNCQKELNEKLPGMENLPIKEWEKKILGIYS